MTLIINKCIVFSMTVSLIAENFHDDFIEILSSTNHSIQIISPFLGLYTCRTLSEYLKANKHIDCKVITRFYREDFIQGVSSIEGLTLLLQSGVDVFALQDLHTKLYIFDDSTAIITSANFTLGGLMNNVELGIMLINEKEIIDACSDYFNDLWERIHEWEISELKQAKVTMEWIEAEEIIVSKLRSTRNNKCSNSNPTKQGAKLSTINKPDLFESNNNTTPEISLTSDAWIKFEADALHRMNHDEYCFQDWKNNRTHFSRRPTGINKGDTIFIAVISYDKNNNPAPVIVGYGIAESFSDENIITSQSEEYEEWMSKYPYYINLYNQQYFNAPIKEGISMTDLYYELNSKIYPTTYGRNDLSVEKLKRYHYQKDKIRITNDAKMHVLKRLAVLFNKFGIKSLKDKGFL